MGLAALALASGCAARYEDALRRDLSRTAGTLRDHDVEAAEVDGSLEGYVALAMARSPELHERYARWRAETLRIARARALPEPTIAYGFYALPVQTRVGPQRHRLSASQSFPWPTRLTAAADAQSARARAAQLRFEARALDVAARVADAWWRLWVVERVAAVWREQLALLGGVSESVRGRIETNQATLADVAQVDLTRSRLDDAIAGLDEQARAARAALRAAVGAGPDVAMAAEGDAGVALPAEPAEALTRAVRAHPFLASFERMAEAGEASAASAEAERFPRFTLGIDWIETGPAAMPGVQGSGDDALIAHVAITVPLWQEAYDDAQRAAEAEAAAERAAGRSAEDAALAELEQALSAVRDTHRRARLYRDTLLPQAQAALESVLGAYAIGRTNVAAVLLAQRDLLEIAVARERALAEHGQAWARVERVVGRRVERAVDEGAGSAP